MGSNGGESQSNPELGFGTDVGDIKSAPIGTGALDMMMFCVFVAFSGCSDELPTPDCNQPASLHGTPPAAPPPPTIQFVATFGAATGSLLGFCISGRSCSPYM